MQDPLADRHAVEPFRFGEVGDLAFQLARLVDGDQKQRGVEPAGQLGGCFQGVSGMVGAVDGDQDGVQHGGPLR